MANEGGPKLVDGGLVGLATSHHDLDVHSDGVVNLGDCARVVEHAVSVCDGPPQLLHKLLGASGYGIVHIASLLQSFGSFRADGLALFAGVVLRDLEGQPRGPVAKMDAAERVDGELVLELAPPPHEPTEVVVDEGDEDGVVRLEDVPQYNFPGT